MERTAFIKKCSKKVELDGKTEYTQVAKLAMKHGIGLSNQQVWGIIKELRGEVKSGLKKVDW